MKETPPVRINITLYGASDETYARLCGNPQGVTQVTRAIRLLKGAGISVKINCSLTPYNADDLEGLSVDSGDDCLDMDNGQNEKTGRQSTEGDGIRCRAGKCSFWVTWDGRFLPCGMLPGENAPNVFETGFDEAWDQAKTDAAAIRLPVECSSCELKDQCRACAAMVLTESGNYHTVPEYRCRMAHEYPAACQQLADEIRRYRDEQKKS